MDLSAQKLILFFILLISISFSLPQCSNNTFNFTLLHTSFLRGSIFPVDSFGSECSPSRILSNETDCIGGSARRQAFLNQIRNEIEITLLVDSGLFFFGSYSSSKTKGQSMATFMNLHQYDFAGFANDDFFVLNDLFSFLSYVNNYTQFVCSNVNATFRPELSKVLPWAIKTIGGEQEVGFISVLDSTTFAQYQVPNITVSSLSTENAVRFAVRELQEIHPECKIIIVSLAETNDFQSIIDTVFDIDIVLSPIPFPYPTITINRIGKPVILVSTLDRGANIGMLNLTFDLSNGVPCNVEGKLVDLTNELFGLGNESVWNLSLSFYNQFNGSFIVGYSENHLSGLPGNDTIPLGATYSDCAACRVMTDALLYFCPDCDVALINGGTIRDSLPAGNISYANLFNLNPFNDKTYTYTISGKFLRDAILNGATSTGGNGRTAQASGLVYAWNPKAPIGERLLEVLVWDRLEQEYRHLDSNQFYKIITADYIYSGGDGYKMLKPNAINVTNGPDMTSILVNFFLANSPLHYPKEEEIYAECVYSAERVPVLSNTTCRVINTNQSLADVLSSCEAGFSFQSSFQSCVACTPGRFSSANSPCSECAPGTYYNGTGATSCYGCPLGKFQPASGAVICQTCPPRYYTTKPSSASCDLCPDQSIENIDITGCECIPSYYGTPIDQDVVSSLETTIRQVAAQSDWTLAKKREVMANVTLKCGINLENRLLAHYDPLAKLYSGFEVDLCRALAGTIFSQILDTSITEYSLTLFDKYISYVELTVNDRLQSLSNGRVDVLFSATERRSERESLFDMAFSQPYFFTQQVMIVPAASNLSETNLTTSYCALDGSLKARVAHFQFPLAQQVSVPFDTQSISGLTYSECAAATMDKLAVQSFRDRGNFKYLASNMHRSAYSVATREGDLKLTELSRWIINGLIIAEQNLLNSTNALAPLNSWPPEVQNLLNSSYGLATVNNALQIVIGSVGNYGEIYARNLEQWAPRNQTQNRLYSPGNSAAGGLLFAYLWQGETNIPPDLANQVLTRKVQKGTTLTSVRARGYVRCGMNGNNPGYGFPADASAKGFDPDLCKAVAAFIFGAASVNRRVEFHFPTKLDRFQALHDKTYDVLLFSTTATLGRDTQLGLDFTPPFLYDGLAIVVRAGSQFTEATDLSLATICLQPGTTTLKSVQAIYPTATLSFFTDLNDALPRLLGGSCDAIAGDYTFLLGLISGRPDYRFLPGFLQREPLAMATLDTDPDWSLLVRWALEALVLSEYYNITQNNIENLDPNNDPELEAFNSSKGFPLTDSAKQAILAVGNMLEIRHRWGLVSNQSALYTLGGLTYPGLWNSEVPFAATLKCATCPLGGDCQNVGTRTDNIKALAGYWPTYSNPPFIPCINNACIGGKDVCADGYYGPLCTVCDTPRFGRSGNFNCTSCPNPKLNAFFLFLVIFALMVALGLYTTYVYKNALQKKGQESALIKIVITTVQSNSIAATYAFTWPNSVRRYLGNQSTTIDWSHSLLNVDCFVSTRDALNSFFIQSLAIFSLPFGLILLSFCILLPIIIFQKRRQKSKSSFSQPSNPNSPLGLEWDENPNPKEAYFMVSIFHSKPWHEVQIKERLTRLWFAAVSISLFVVYPMLVQQTFNLFSCKDIGPKIVLLKDMTVECWTPKHLRFSLGVGIPMILFYVVGIPCFMIYNLLIAHPKPLPPSDADLCEIQKWELSVRYYWRKFGLLFKGYRYNYRFWEIIVVVRKVSLIIVAVFVDFNPRAQGILGVALFTLFMLLQATFHPFNSILLNRFELASLASTYSVFLLGLFYLSNDFSTDLRANLSVVIVIANISFFAVALYYLITGYYRKGKQKFIQYRTSRRNTIKPENSSIVEDDVLASPASVRRTMELPTRRITSQVSVEPEPSSIELPILLSSPSLGPDSPASSGESPPGTLQLETRNLDSTPTSSHFDGIS